MAAAQELVHEHADLLAQIEDLADQVRRLSLANDSRKRIRDEIYRKAAKYDELLPVLEFANQRADAYKSVLVDIAMGNGDAEQRAGLVLSIYPE